MLSTADEFKTILYTSLSLLFIPVWYQKESSSSKHNLPLSDELLFMGARGAGGATLWPVARCGPDHPPDPKQWSRLSRTSQRARGDANATSKTAPLSVRGTFLSARSLIPDFVCLLNLIGTFARNTIHRASTPPHYYSVWKAILCKSTRIIGINNRPFAKQSLLAELIHQTGPAHVRSPVAAFFLQTLHARHNGVV